MSNAEEKAIQYCCTKCENNKLNCGMKLLSNGRNCIECHNYIAGYHQAEKDLTDKAKVSSGWDGFYYGQGYKQAKKDLELTYDDICEIMEIREDVLEMDSYENLYEEILKRFKDFKEKKR